MKLVIEHSAPGDLSVQTNLFKMQTDQLSFEKFEELFDDDDDEADFPDEPLFDSEWKRSKVIFLSTLKISKTQNRLLQNFCLHTNQPAVFIAVADVVQFIEPTAKPTKFFIYYEVTTALKAEVTTARMVLHAACVDIDYRMLLTAESEIGMGAESNLKCFLFENCLWLFFSLFSLQRPVSSHINIDDGSAEFKIW